MCVVAGVARAATLNLSTDLKTLGIASSNMVPNQPTLDSGPLFEKAIKYAVANKVTSVLANPGAYYFLSISATNSVSVLRASIERSNLDAPVDTSK